MNKDPLYRTPSRFDARDSMTLLLMNLSVLIRGCPDRVVRIMKVPLSGQRKVGGY